MGEHSRFVSITIDAAVERLFEDGYAKESAKILSSRMKQFLNHAQKDARPPHIKHQPKRGMLP